MSSPIGGIDTTKAIYDQRLAEKRAEIEENEERYADFLRDDMKERWYEERYELENGRFADVDQ